MRNAGRKLKRKNWNLRKTRVEPSFHRNKKGGFTKSIDREKLNYKINEKFGWIELDYNVSGKMKYKVNLWTKESTVITTTEFLTEIEPEKNFGPNF